MFFQEQCHDFCTNTSPLLPLPLLSMLTQLTHFRNAFTMTLPRPYPGAPTFTTEPTDVVGQVGMVFSDKLECVASGTPPPTLTWLDPTLTEIPLDSSTQLPLIAGGGRLTLSDGGVYTCVAANSRGEIRSQFTLTVQGRAHHTVELWDLNQSTPNA